MDFMDLVSQGWWPYGFHGQGQIVRHVKLAWFVHWKVIQGMKGPRRGNARAPSITGLAAMLQNHRGNR